MGCSGRLSEIVWHIPPGTHSPVIVSAEGYRDADLGAITVPEDRELVLDVVLERA